jgi:flagellar motor protein MotB
MRTHVKIFLSFLCLLIFTGLFIEEADARVSVKGYYRKDGTYVKPHYRSDPDGSKTNNWSYCGNVNPTTGKVGTVDCNGASNGDSQQSVQQEEQQKLKQDQKQQEEQQKLEDQRKLDEKLKQDQKQQEEQKKLEDQRKLEEKLKQDQKQQDEQVLEVVNKKEQDRKLQDQMTTETLRKSARKNYNPVFVPANVKVYFNQGILAFEQEPVIVDGSTLVPLRAIIESLGGVASWDEDAQIITVVKDGKTIKMQIGNQNAYINNEPTIIDTAPMLVNGSTMIPTRFITETFAAKVNWNQDTRTISINK